MNLWMKLRSLLAYEPAVIAWVVNGGLAVVLTFLFNLNTTQTAAVTTITTALAAIVTALAARPVSVSIVTGALMTAIQAAVAFGVTMPTPVLGAITAVASAMLSLLFRQNLTPAVKMADKAV